MATRNTVVSFLVGPLGARRWISWSCESSKTLTYISRKLRTTLLNREVWSVEIIGEGCRVHFPCHVTGGQYV